MAFSRRSVFAKIAALFGVSAGVAASVQGRRADDGPMVALGYLSRILPDDYVMCPAPMKLAEDIVAHVDGIKSECERREVSLAGVSAASLGATGALNTAQRDDWAWHPAYQDALDLRRKFDAALRMLSERMPQGQQIMFYPCGCAALGNPPDGEMLPLQCNAIAHEGGPASIVRAAPAKPRPTIEELEAILAQDGNGPNVWVLPNGEVTV